MHDKTELDEISWIKIDNTTNGRKNKNKILKDDIIGSMIIHRFLSRLWQMTVLISNIIQQVKL